MGSEMCIRDRYLGETNYRFEEMDDGSGILERLPEINPDLILLDWQMPRQGGLETLKLIKKNLAFKDIPIIIITGLQDEKVLEEAFDFGTLDFLNKPVSKIELMARVLNAIKLHEATKSMVTQKKELIELNKIINNQKDELEKSLAIKTELFCLLYTSPSPRDLSTSRMPSSA